MEEVQILIEPCEGSSSPCNVLVDQGHRNPPYVYTKLVKNEIEERAFIEECISKIQARCTIRTVHFNSLLGCNSAYKKWLSEEKGLNVLMLTTYWHRGEDANPFLIKCAKELY